MAQRDRTAALAALEANGGNVKLTATQLGIPRPTLIRWRAEALKEESVQKGGVSKAVSKKVSKAGHPIPAPAAAIPYAVGVSIEKRRDDQVAAAPRFCGREKRGSGGELCTQPAGHRTDHQGEGACWLHGGGTPIQHGLYSGVRRARVAELIAEFEGVSEAEALRTFPELAAARALFVEWVERYDEATEALLAWYESYSATQRKLPQDKALAFQNVIDDYEELIAQQKGAELSDRQRSDLDAARAFVQALRKGRADESKPRQMPDLADGHRILDTISKIVDRIEKQRSASAISREALRHLIGELARAVEHVLIRKYGEVETVPVLTDIRDRWLNIHQGKK